MKFSLLFLLTFQITAVAQKRVTVNDLEIEFSYEQPKGWESYDDTYSLYLLPPSQFSDENFSITYVVTDGMDLHQQFDFTIRLFYPNNEPSDELVRELNAKWAVFDSEQNSIKYRSFLFFFLENGQVFKLRGTARQANFDSYKKQFWIFVNQLSQEINKLTNS